MVKSKINVDADKRFHLRITQWSYPICDSWTSTSIRHWLLASQPTSKEYCTVCLWEIFNIILYFPVDCLFRVKTITLETANVTNCHVIATEILFLSSNHRSVQFLYLAASLWPLAAMLKYVSLCWATADIAHRRPLPHFESPVPTVYPTVNIVRFWKSIRKSNIFAPWLVLPNWTYDVC